MGAGKACRRSAVESGAPSGRRVLMLTLVGLACAGLVMPAASAAGVRIRWAKQGWLSQSTRSDWQDSDRFGSTYVNMREPGISGSPTGIFKSQRTYGGGRWRAYQARFRVSTSLKEGYWVHRLECTSSALGKQATSGDVVWARSRTSGQRPFAFPAVSNTDTWRLNELTVGLNVAVPDTPVSVYASTQVPFWIKVPKKPRSVEISSSRPNSMPYPSWKWIAYPHNKEADDFEMLGVTTYFARVNRHIGASVYCSAEIRTKSLLHPIEGKKVATHYVTESFWRNRA